MQLSKNLAQDISIGATINYYFLQRAINHSVQFEKIERFFLRQIEMKAKS